MKITVLEFTPCVDVLYQMRRDPEEGYIDGEAISITLPNGGKLRPRLAMTYAGGKATNVARVIDRLLGPDDRVEVELVVFRSDSAEGRYLHELQIRDLRRVRVSPVHIESESRFCIDMADPATDSENHIEFNISPRARWRAASLDTALEFASTVKGELVVLAGSPPLIEESGELARDLYVRIIERLRSQVSVISLDTADDALADCLASNARPDLIKINAKEYSRVDVDLWNGFEGAMVVTEADGCKVWGRGVATLPDTIRVPKRRNVYSTIGAGDAVHAGLIVARWVRGLGLLSAARFGQAAAAAAVTSPEGTRGISEGRVRELQSELGF